MADLFISYAHEDEARIRPLAYALEEQGWSVFWDRRIPAGQTWRSYIGQALIDASCVIVAWSRHSIASKWVVEEADEGQKRGILVPVLLDSVEPPIGFRSIQAADLSDWQPNRPSLRFKQLVRDINGSLGSPPTPPASKRAAEPEVEPYRQWSELPQSQPKVSSYHLTYALLAVILVLAAGGSYWVYQKWLSNSAVGSGVYTDHIDNRLKQLAGSYHVRGKNPNGTSYVGEATIKHKGDHYELVWKIANKQTYYGTGVLVDNLFRVKWEHGLVTYILREDGALDGSWADGQGIETLIPDIND